MLFRSYNCVDVSQFNKELWIKERCELRKEYGVNDDEVLIMFSGRLNAEKGIIELIKAFRMVKNKNIKLLIVGSFFYDTDMGSNQDKQINSLTKGIRDKMIFTGYIPYQKMPQIYASADFAVLPSMWEEPAGLTVIEAMSTGLPVITTNSGGIPEYVTCECAFLINRDKNICAAIANKIELLVTNKELRIKMGNKGRKNALKYNVENYYKNFVKIISN